MIKKDILNFFKIVKFVRYFAWAMNHSSFFATLLINWKYIISVTILSLQSRFFLNINNIWSVETTTIYFEKVSDRDRNEMRCISRLLVAREKMFAME